MKHSESRPTEFSFGKELWIFWYGDRPSVLDEILSPELKGKNHCSVYVATSVYVVRLPVVMGLF